MAVITISRLYGSGGDEIASLLCKGPSCRLFDKHIISRAAADAGLSENEVFDFSDENYRATSFFNRLFRASRTISERDVWIETPSGERVTEHIQLTEEAALSFERKAIEYACQLGNTVIMGRGGQAILKNTPGVLHVRVIAPMEDRILRVRKDPQVTGRHLSSQVEIRRCAQDLIESHDAASADYLKRFYGVDWSDPLLYHLVLNTGKLTNEEAAAIIAETAQKLERALEAA